MTKRQRVAYGNAATYFVLIVIVLLINLPTLSMIGTALKGRSEALSSSALIPRNPTLQNFADVIAGSTFPRNVFNSFWVATVVTIACIVIASTAAYALSRFRGKVFTLYGIGLLMLQMFPGVLLLIPLFVIFRTLGLVDTPFSVLLAYTTINLPFSTWMMKGFFDSIPMSLEESAMIDGCSQFRAFYLVVLPISAPGIATVGIFTFVNSWNEYLLASVFLRRNEIRTLTVGLQQFVQQYSSQWGLLMAASTISTIPTLIILLFAQRYLVQGLTAGAIKG